MVFKIAPRGAYRFTTRCISCVMSFKKGVFLLGLCVCTFLLGMTTFARTLAQVAMSTIRVEPQLVEVGLGESAEVVIMLEDVDNVYGIDVQMTYDHDSIEIVDADPNTTGVQISPGTFLKPDFVVRNIADNENGSLRYVVTQISPTPVATGSGILLTIQVRGISAESETMLVFDAVEMASPDGFLLPVNTQDGLVHVMKNASTAISLPTNTPVGTSASTPTTSAAVPTSTPTQVVSSATATTAPPPVAEVDVSPTALAVTDDAITPSAVATNATSSADVGTPTPQQSVPSPNEALPLSVADASTAGETGDSVVATNSAESAIASVDVTPSDAENSVQPAIIGANVPIESDNMDETSTNQSAPDNAASNTLPVAILLVLLVLVLGLFVWYRRHRTR